NVEMVLQSAADLCACTHDGNAKRRKVRPRTDTRKHEQLRRSDGSPRQDNLAACHRLADPAAMPILNRGGSPILEPDPLDQRTGQNPQVPALARMLQVACGGAAATHAPHSHLIIAGAFLCRAV